MKKRLPKKYSRKTQKFSGKLLGGLVITVLIVASFVLAQLIQTTPSINRLAEPGPTPGTTILQTEYQEEHGTGTLTDTETGRNVSTTGTPGDSSYIPNIMDPTNPNASSAPTSCTAAKKKECEANGQRCSSSIDGGVCKGGTTTPVDPDAIDASGDSCPGEYTSIGSGSWAQTGGFNDPYSGENMGHQMCVQCIDGIWQSGEGQAVDCATVDEIPRPDEIIEGTSDSQAGCYSGGTLYAAGSTLGGQSCSDGHWCGANQEWDNGTSKCIAKTAAPAATASTCTPGCDGNNVRTCPAGGGSSFTSCGHPFGSTAQYCVVSGGVGSCSNGSTVSDPTKCTPGVTTTKNSDGTYTCGTPPAGDPPAGAGPAGIACDLNSTCDNCPTNPDGTTSYGPDAGGQYHCSLAAPVIAPPADSGPAGIKCGTGTSFSCSDCPDSLSTNTTGGEFCKYADPNIVSSYHECVDANATYLGPNQWQCRDGVIGGVEPASAPRDESMIVSSYHECVGANAIYLGPDQWQCRDGVIGAEEPALVPDSGPAGIKCGTGTSFSCSDCPDYISVQTTEGEFCKYADPIDEANPVVVGAAAGAICVGVTLVVGFFTAGIGAIPTAIGCSMIAVGVGAATGM